MTKAQIIKWVERKKQDALLKIGQCEKDEKAEYRDSLFAKHGVTLTAANVQRLLIEALNLWDGLKEDLHSTDEGIRLRSCCYSLDHRVRSFVTSENATLDQVITCLNIDTPDISRIEKKYSDKRERVIQNYNSLIGNVRSLKNAKAGLEYIRSLGLNVSELEKLDAQQCTAVMAPVDIKFIDLGEEL